jgi:hypothetical protein
MHGQDLAGSACGMQELWDLQFALHDAAGVGYHIQNAAPQSRREESARHNFAGVSVYVERSHVLLSAA